MNCLLAGWPSPGQGATEDTSERSATCVSECPEVATPEWAGQAATTNG